MSDSKAELAKRCRVQGTMKTNGLNTRVLVLHLQATLKEAAIALAPPPPDRAAIEKMLVELLNHHRADAASIPRHTFALRQLYACQEARADGVEYALRDFRALAPEKMLVELLNSPEREERGVMAYPISCMFGWHTYGQPVYSTQEDFIAIDTVNNEWVDQNRSVKHYICKGCGKHKAK